MPKSLIRFVLIQLLQLKSFGVLPLGVAFALIKFNSLLMISWSEIARYGDIPTLKGSPFCLLEQRHKLLPSFCNGLEAFPSVCFQQVVLLGENGARHQIILGNQV